MKPNNPSLRVNSFHSKIPKNPSVNVPKFHSAAIKPNPNVNRFSLFPPSKGPVVIPYASLHIFTPSSDLYDKPFKPDEKANNIDQTNLHGRQSSSPPSGHSYGSSHQKYGEYAGQDEAKNQYGFQAVGSSTTNWTPGGGSPASSSAGPASGGQATDWPSGQTGGAQTGGTQTGYGSNPVTGGTGGTQTSGTQTGYGSNPVTGGTAGTQSKTDPWTQSGYASGTTDYPPVKTSEKQDKSKDATEDDTKSRASNAQDVDILKREFSSSAFPEVSSGTDVFKQTQADRKESSYTGSTSEVVKQGGVESQYDKRQFNNAFNDLQQKAPETADVVRDAAVRAAETITRGQTDPIEGAFAGIKFGSSGMETETTGASTGGRVAAEKKGKAYENQVKGLEHKDESFFADSMNKGKGKMESKLKDAYSTIDTTAKDYEHKVKGTDYTELNESDKDQQYTTSFDPSNARDARDAVRDIAREGEKSGKDTMDWMAQKAQNAKETVEQKANEWMGKDTVDWMAQKAQNVKDTVDQKTTEWMGKDTKDWMAEKAQNMKDTVDQKANEWMGKDTKDWMAQKAQDAKDTVDQKANEWMGKDTKDWMAQKAQNAKDTVDQKANEWMGKDTKDWMAQKAQEAKGTVEQKKNDWMGENATQKASDAASSTLHTVEEKVKDTANWVGEKARSVYNSTIGTAQDAANTMGNKTQDVINDITAGQRTVPGRNAGEQRVVTGDDVKQDSGHGINLQAVTSTVHDIVNKVKETAETMKEKVGNIFHSSTSDTAGNVHTRSAGDNLSSANDNARSYDTSATSQQRTSDNTQENSEYKKNFNNDTVKAQSSARSEREIPHEAKSQQTAQNPSVKPKTQNPSYGTNPSDDSIGHASS